MGAGNQIKVLCKNNKYSKPLSHLSKPNISLSWWSSKHCHRIMFKTLWNFPPLEYVLSNPRFILIFMTHLYRIIPRKLCFPFPGSCGWTMNDCWEDKHLDLLASRALLDKRAYGCQLLPLPTSQFTQSLYISLGKFIIKPETVDVHGELRMFWKVGKSGSKRKYFYQVFPMQLLKMASEDPADLTFWRFVWDLFSH